MPDDEPVTRREYDRDIARLDRGQQAQDDRIAKLAENTVPVAVHTTEIANLAGDLAEQKQASIDAHKEIRAEMAERHRSAMEAITDVREGIERRSQFSRQQLIAVLAIVATLVAAWIAVALSSGGHK
jgi:hypothetical protein